MTDEEYWELEHTFTNNFLNLCPPESKKYAKELVNFFLNSHPQFSFKENDLNLFNRLIGSHPVLKRIIYYTYSPVEKIDVRMRMLAGWNGMDIGMPSIFQQHIDFVQDCSYIYFVLSDCEIQKSPILKAFLEKMHDNASRVMAADIRKEAGAEGTIEELRLNSLRCEKTKDVKTGIEVEKYIIDHSPFYRNEIVIKNSPNNTSKIESHIYVMEKGSADDVFENTDIYLIDWMQWFKDAPQLQEVAFSGEIEVFIFDKKGKKIVPTNTKAHRNPFSFALEPKWRNLRKRIQGQYPLERKMYRKYNNDSTKQEWEKYFPEGKIKIDRHWDMEQIFKKAIMKYKRDILPSTYFKNALKWGFLSLEKPFRERFVERKELGSEFLKVNPISKKPVKYILQDDVDSSGGFLNEDLKDQDGNIIDEKVNLIAASEHDVSFEIEILDFISALDHPADRLILRDLWEACHGSDPDVSHSSDAELARQLKNKNVNLTPQYVGKRRQKLFTALQNFYADQKKIFSK